jgi:hypothetical protein
MIMALKIYLILLVLGTVLVSTFLRGAGRDFSLESEEQTHLPTWSQPGAATPAGELRPLLVGRVAQDVPQQTLRRPVAVSVSASTRPPRRRRDLPLGRTRS